MPSTVASELTARTLLGFDLPVSSSDAQQHALLADVARRLSVMKPDWAMLAPHLVFDARNYRRVRLWRDEAWEGILLCWLPGQRTTIHDHGGSTGATKVLMGSLHEVRYAWDGPGHAPVAASRQAVLTGEVTTEAVTTIHEVANESHFPAASLHLYAPPLTTLGAFDVEVGTRRAIDVTDSPVIQVGGDPQVPA